MKSTTQKIINKFPMLEDYIPNHEDVLLEEETRQKLDDLQWTFLKLIWFFEKPDESNFNLFDLYKNLQDERLSFALECITDYFMNDTYLLKNPTFSIVTEDRQYFNQADFTQFLNDHKKQHGKNFTRGMLNMYVKRGVAPEPDLVIAGTKYWLKETCEYYLDKLNR